MPHDVDRGRSYPLFKMREKSSQLHDRAFSETRSSYAANDARAGEIILRTRRRRLIFVSGLVAWGLFAILALFSPIV